MQTRLPLIVPRHQRYISPKPACSTCQRHFHTYHDVYLHTLETHKQTIDTTFTCTTCLQVCQNHKGLAVHRSHTHKARRRPSGEAEESLYKQRCTEDSIAKVIKLELPAASTDVVCPACGQTFTKAEMETHMSGHDEEIASAYHDLPNTAKMTVAALVMEMASVKKTE